MKIADEGLKRFIGQWSGNICLHCSLGACTPGAVQQTDIDPFECQADLKYALFLGAQRPRVELGVQDGLFRLGQGNPRTRSPEYRTHDKCQEAQASAR